MGLRPGSFLTLFHPTANAQATDAELLDRFRHDRDEIAFTELVRRHGAMVFGVCRRLLTHWHDAEDAFQATFLVLACKPRAVGPPERLGAWLHGVACKIAQRARRTESRRLNNETHAVLNRPTESFDSVPDDVREVIDDLLLALPARYRTPVVLCDLEGLTRKDAAVRLGWTEGLLSGRLARARKLLADRLTRRGVTLGVGGIGAVLSALAAPAAVAGELTVSTLAITRLVRGGLDTLPAGPVAALAHGITLPMFPTRFNLFVGLLGIGLVLGIAVNFLPASPANPSTEAPLPLPHLSKLPITTQAPKPAAPTWRERVTLMHTAAVSALAIGPADTLYAGDGNDYVIAWNIREEKKIRTILDGAVSQREGPIDLLALHPEGKWLYIVNKDHLIQMNLEKNTGNGRGGVKFLGFTPDGRAFIHLDATDATRVVFHANGFPKTEGAVPADLKHKSDVVMLATSSETILATMTADNKLHAWDTAKPEEPLWSVAVDKLELTALGVSPAGDQIAVAGKDGVVRLFDGRTGKELHRLTGHTGTVHALAFSGTSSSTGSNSGDGSSSTSNSSSGKATKLVTAGADKTLHVWNLNTGKELAVLKGHTDAVRCVIINPDGTFIASGSADKTIKVWELKP